MLPSPPAEAENRPRSKRKLRDVEAEETRDSTFQLVNLGDDTCFDFEPVTKLLRAHLPLSWLAAAHPTDVIASGSVLKGSISRVTAWEYSTLIVRLLPNGGLYALEKIEDTCYVLHTLQPFVAEKWVVDASIGAVPHVNTQMLLHYLPISTTCEPQQIDSRRTLSISSENELKIAKNRRGAAARLSILGHSNRQDSQPASPVLSEVKMDLIPMACERDEIIKTVCSSAKTVVEVNDELVEVEPAAEDSNSVVDMLSPDYLRQRYLETLYTTRSPLSYYSKGPLSRARARARAHDASIDLVELAVFYRDSLLPPKKLDLKYKQSIRATVNQIHNSTSDIENAKKCKKRTRLGKDGLWPVEPKYLAKWWRETQNLSRSSVISETLVGQAISALRMREAQMQILLILEILSIEAKQPGLASIAPAALPVVVEAPQHTEVKLESVEKDVDLTKKSQKLAKKRTLEVDLELLADKLCIWHSIGLEDNTLSDGSDTCPARDEMQSHSKDSLRNFCSEVLIPFYSTKLPLICRALCKTLAGPELYDRAAKTARLKEEKSKTAAPGDKLLRRPPSRSGTLDRVLSDDNHRQASPPVLLRSATLPPLPYAKREASQTPQRQLNRQASMSFTSREVDLVADANMTAVKRRKLDLVAVQKQELASAIQALKKPNRQVLANSYMDDAEARKVKLSNPILITATPRTHRKKTLVDVEMAPILEPLLVPASGSKRTNRPPLPKGAPFSQKKKAVLAALQDTPSKTSMKKMMDPQALAKDRNSIPLETPIHEGDSFVFATPTKQKSDALDGTPSKNAMTIRTPNTDNFVLTEVAFKVMDRAMSKPVSQHSDSIYAQLGWEDDQLIDI